MPNYLAGLNPMASVGYRDQVGYTPAPNLSNLNLQSVSRGSSPRFDIATDRANMIASMAYPDVPGVPARDAAMLPTAWPVFSFALATGTNSITQQMNVQTPFRGQRLVATVIRNGASAALTAPIVTVLQVGMKPIIATPTGVPLEIWGQAAFDTNVLLPPTLPGTIYTLTMNLQVALTTTDTILCFVGIIGSAVL